MSDDRTFTNNRINFVNRMHEFPAIPATGPPMVSPAPSYGGALNCRTRTATASQQQLAANMGIAERTVRRLLIDLRPLGLLVNQGMGRGAADIE